MQLCWPDIWMVFYPIDIYLGYSVCQGNILDSGDETEFSVGDDER